jgi:hypothetical protein
VLRGESEIGLLQKRSLSWTVPVGTSKSSFV